MNMQQEGYELIVTSRDPREEDARQVDFSRPTSRTVGKRDGKYWADRGYWASLYDAFTGECLEEFKPQDSEED